MDDITKNRARWFRHTAERSFLHFSQFIFRQQFGRNLIVSPYHKVLCETLSRVERGEIKHLIINIPPSYTKTELAVVSFISHGLAINPRSRFIHTSYSDALVLQNSSRVKEIVSADYFQRYWPNVLRVDSRAKSIWRNSFAGGLYAVSAGGAITGFHAGLLESSKAYGGAIVIDDPLKASDAYSRVIRDRRNNWINNSIKSRVANPDVPIILIMQRVHDDDPTGFLLRGGSGDVWDHLCIPALYEPSAEYPAEYTHGRPIPVSLEAGPIWPFIHDAEALERLRQADKYTYSSQYMQRPSPEGDSMFSSRNLTRYESFDPRLATVSYASGAKIDIRSAYVICDTAHKKGQSNDYSVIALWGFGSDGRLYLLDMVRNKFTAPELRRAFGAAIERWGSSERRIAPREVLIEDKASGIGLLQEIREDVKQNSTRMPNIVGIPRNVDKVSRAYNSAGAVENGMICIPRVAPFVNDFIKELDDFSPMMTHRHDDQLDTMFDAIQYILHSKKTISYKEVI